MNKFKQFLTEVAAAQSLEEQESLREGLLRDKVGDLRSLIQGFPSLEPKEYYERLEEIRKFLYDAASEAQEESEAQELYDYAFDSLIDILKRITKAKVNSFRESIGPDLTMVEYVLKHSGFFKARKTLNGFDYYYGESLSYSDSYNDIKSVMEHTGEMNYPEITLKVLYNIWAILKEFSKVTDTLEELAAKGLEGLELPNDELHDRIARPLNRAERLLKGEDELKIGLDKVKELMETNQFEVDIEALFTHYYRKRKY